MLRKTIQWFFVSILFIIAITSLAGRLLIHNIDSYRNEITQELKDYGMSGIQLDTIKGDWRGLLPTVHISNVLLTSVEGKQTLRLKDLNISINLLKSFYHRELRLKKITGTVENITISHDSLHTWKFNDNELSFDPNSASTETDYSAFFKYLPKFVDLNIPLIEIEDNVNKTHYSIRNSRLVSRTSFGRMSLDIRIKQAENLGNNIRLLAKGTAKNSRLFFTADELDLVRLTSLLDKRDWPLLSGAPVIMNRNALLGKTDWPLLSASASLKSWLTFKKSKIQKIVTKASIFNVKQMDSADEEAFNFDVLKKIVKVNNEWKLLAGLSKIEKGSLVHPDINLAMSTDDNGNKLWVDRLNLETLLALFKNDILDKTQLEIVEKTNPKALISNLIMRHNSETPLNSEVMFDLTRASTQYFNNIPGIDNLSATVLYKDSNAKLKLNTTNSLIDFGSLFRAPLSFDVLKTDINFSLLDNGKLIADSQDFEISNTDVKTKGRFFLETEKGAMPFLNLYAQYFNGDAIHTHRYLPTKIMPESVVSWLDRSIKGGEVTSGELLYHGRLQSFKQMHQQQSGEFHTQFKMRNPIVDYLPHWPVASQGAGEVSFHNLEMDINASNVQYGQIKVEKLNVRIPNLVKSGLLIKAKSLNSTDELVSTLSSLPVIDWMDKIKQKISKTSGLIDTQLQLEIPIQDKSINKVDIKAIAGIQNSSLLMPDWGLDLKNLNGNIIINNDVIKAPQLNALFYNDPVKIVISTDTKKSLTKFDINGKLHSKNLVQLLPDYVKKSISGESDWQIGLAVANEQINNKPVLTINASSDFVGSSLSFPKPLVIAPNSPSKVEMEGRLMPNDDFLLKLTMGDTFRSKGKFTLAKNVDNNLLGLQLALGKGKQLIDRGKINISGTINYLDIDEWNKYIHQFYDNDQIESSGLLDEVGSSGLFIKELLWAGLITQDAELVLTDTGNQIKGKIHSSNLQGNFLIPDNITPSTPIIADMDKIHFEEIMGDSNGEFDPSINNMPSLKVTSHKISTKNMSFTDFILDTEATEKKFTVNKLQITHDEVGLHSFGHWEFNKKLNSHKSNFSFAVNGENFGNSISTLGLGETIDRGKIKFFGQVGWSGELFDMNWPSLSGKMDLDLRDGYLKNVDPGAGRFVGLLSVNALPKRLFLDFGDVVKDGMQFDKIRGKFTLQGENLKTSNAKMDGSSAKVRFVGATNLRKKTYNQTMYITPKISETIPLIGGLAAGNAVGWGLLLLQKIFKKPIDKSVQVEYKITGSWDEPIIKEVKKKPKNATKESKK